MQRLVHRRLNRNVPLPTHIPQIKREVNPIINNKESVGAKFRFVDDFYTFHNDYVDNKECIVVVPIYKHFEDLTQLEKDSLMQCINVLGGDYEICLLLPYNLGLKGYHEYYHYQFSTLRCNPRYFKSQQTYGLFCCKTEFYSSFKEYNYMLIYQLDAWVFKNELHEWCEKGYEYIGAPIEDSLGGLNGGFSLRKISAFIEKKVNRPHWIEDRIYSKLMKCPSYEEASSFSVEDAKYSQYIIDEKVFGCHYSNLYFTNYLPSNLVLKWQLPIKIFFYDYENYSISL